jgi:predicted nucleic acid-binding protein
LRVIVDSSVLVAGMGRRSRVRRLLFRNGIEWVVPSEIRGEVLDRIDELARRLKARPMDARLFVVEILGRATEIDLRPEEPASRLARDLIGRRDPSDIPFVGAAIKLGALGVWSLDKDFDGIPGVPRFTTAGIERLLDLSGPSEEE